MSRLNKIRDSYTRVKDKESAMILNELIKKTDNKKPIIIKKGNAVYQQEFFNLLSVISPNRDHNWNQKFKVLCEEITKNNPDLLQSLKVKYQNLNPKIINNV